MKEKELARLFYIEVRKIHEQESLDQGTRVEAQYRLLNLLFVDATRDERIQFSTLFARIAYACQKYLIPKQLQFYIHTFRKECRLLLLDKSRFSTEELYPFGLKLLAETISQLFNQAIPTWLQKIIPHKYGLELSPHKVVAFKPNVRVAVLEDDKEAEQLIGFDEDQPERQVRIQYGIADRNENFMPSIRAIRQIFGFPTVMNLLDVEIDEQGVYRPKGFVIEPDYLVDVTSVAECFIDTGTEPILYLLKRYLPFESSKYLLLGNIANFFLDELMTNPEATFKDLFPQVFRLSPLAFTLLDDKVVREIMQLSQKHYINLKRMVLQGFEEVAIPTKDCFLEPSFFSETYGLQGRLDVFYKNPNSDTEAAIVELKSGKTFRPNRYGINQNHYTQTLLYDLIIKSTFGKHINPTNYILYSGMDQRQLRYAPVTKAQQMEALQVRNQLIAIDRKLSQLESDEEALFRRLSTARYPKLKGFLQQDIALFEKTFQALSPIERAYFIAFSAFIAREQQLAKIGMEGVERANGLASLWRTDFQYKQDHFAVLANLSIEKLDTQADEPVVVFRKTTDTNALANFRVGDLVVLYPFDRKDATVLDNQIFKCSIIALDKTHIQVRLRSKQFNNRIFEAYDLWNMEHDMMDSSFTAMYRGLFAFAQSSPVRRELLLGKKAPDEALLTDISIPKDLTEEQGHIFKKIVHTKDYFLLWGPPGTGKTSKMLRSLADYLLHHTEENILLLAYTNRAVDEICEAIERISHEDIRSQYIRIGSRYGTAPAYQSQLLQTKIEHIRKRDALQKVLDDHRIFVSTVASVASRTSLLELKHFHTVIIDEASQILEPLLVGLLPKFDRFVLIGDHKQLPAVVVQDVELSKTDNPLLHEIGLDNLRNALFERLYRQCQAKGWHWAYANLSHQGRMHQDIMAFPNTHFYGGTLRILPDSIPFYKEQVYAPDYVLPSNEVSSWIKKLCQHRMVFIDTPAETQVFGQKINTHEARQVVELLQYFQHIYTQNKLPFDSKTLGVITPFRAQIAQIRKVLEEQSLDPDLVTIDTIERYQGGARDIILISLCTNSAGQMASMISLSEEGVDRKLNVALTRARKHLVLIGNATILQTNPIYKALLEHCVWIEVQG